MIKFEMMMDCHVGAVAQLEKLCFQDPWSETSVRSEVTNPLSLWLVALDEDRLVGYVGSQSVMGEADMMNLAVDPDYRCRGIGSSLVNGLVSALKARDVSSLTLEVHASNEKAIRLYLAHGFTQVGRRPNYYRNPKEDALILRKEWLL